MRQKGILFSVMILVITLLLGIVTPEVQAATTSTPLYLGVTELRKNDTPNFGYAIGDPNTNGATGNAAKIWNILEYTSADDGAQEKANGAKNIYCVKAGVGFSNTHKRAEYNVFYDMKTEREQIKAQNETLKSIVEGNVTSGNTTVSKYDALLALADRLYLIDEENNETAKTEYLKLAGITSDAYDVLLTRDDITAVQQAAIWYFTNYGEENGKYDKTQDTGWLNYTTDGVAYTSLGDYNLSTNEGRQRQEQAEILYKYLIKTAIANANNYTNAEVQTGAPARVITNTLSCEITNSNCIAGPIHIEEATGNTLPYTIDITVKNGDTVINDYKLLNNNKSEVVQGTTVKDLVGQDFYISVPQANSDNLSVSIRINYNNTSLKLWASTKNNQEQPVMIPTEEPKSEEITLSNKTFDLALRKYITKINGEELTGANSRVPNVDESALTTATTATYKHKKDPVLVKTGDVVTYKMTIYNEGNSAGRATKVVDQLPTGLKFSKVVSGNFEANAYNEESNTLNLTRKVGNTTDLSGYTTGNLSSETIEIECTVEATPDAVKNTVLTNIAYISEEINGETGVTITNQKGADRDSEPSTKPDANKDNMSNYRGNGNKEDLTDKDYYYKGQQDDDDFEKLILMPESFDLKLIKRITAVNNQNVPERIEKIDASKLNTIGADGNLITTADYTLNKEPVGVKKGDIVTYTFRVYNEGTIDGYASELTEDIPDGLEFLWSEKEGEDLKADTTLSADEKEAIEFNQKYLWSNFKYNDNKDKITQISTSYLSKDNETTPGANLIKAFGSNDGTKTEKDLSYKEVPVKFRVTSENVGTIIRNEACISKDTDKGGNEVDDRDSDTKIWKKYEDDEDYDNIKLQSFDLALRKFIAAVSEDEQIDDNEYLKNADGSYKRAPVVDTSKLNTNDDNGKLITTATYNHTKEPIIVKQNDMVVYMLRVYNEGDINGYASEIKDHLPPYLEFVDNDYNKKYGWTISDDGRTVTTTYLSNSLINKAEKDESGKYVLSYAEVPIMCKVSENAKTSENITNIADITEYKDENKNKVTDRDSQANNVNLPADSDLPGYKGDEKGDYVPGQQDDDDFEKVIVKTFDLALRKWVTQAIVTDKNGTTITETGHQPYDDPEEIVKVDLHRKHINDVTVKFRYSIRVVNEGEIAGYAKEVKDYIPEGLKFLAEDNPQWTQVSDNIITTDALANTLLQPGEYADVEVILTWINNADNMGLKVNTAEISKDYNDYNIPDKDSTPDNQKPGEDDIDDAPVMLSVSTGAARTYFTLGGIVLVTLAGGIFLIKKYIL